MTRGASGDRTGPAGFGLWLLGGAVLTFLGLSLPSALFIGLPVAALVAAALSWRSWLPGLFIGVSLPLFWVASRNRGGPGWVSFETPTGGGGYELLDPTPWLLAAGGFLVAAVALLLLGRLLSRSARAPTP